MFIKNKLNFTMHFTDAEIKLIYQKLGYKLVEAEIKVTEKRWSWPWQDQKYQEKIYNVVRIYDKNDIEVLTTGNFILVNTTDKHDWKDWPNFKWPRRLFEFEILPVLIKQTIFPDIFTHQQMLLKN